MKCNRNVGSVIHIHTLTGECLTCKKNRIIIIAVGDVVIGICLHGAYVTYCSIHVAFSHLYVERGTLDLKIEKKKKETQKSLKWANSSRKEIQFIFFFGIVLTASSYL